jgi:hypothetical protein
MRPALLPAAAVFVLALALLAPAEAQTAGPGQGQAKAYQLFPSQQLHPPPTGLAAGDAIVFDWAVTEPAGAQLFFSQHIHIGAQQLNLSESTRAAEQGRLVADREGQYSILWENRGKDTLLFDYTYHTERASGGAGSKPAPLPALAAALALGGAALALRNRRR